MTCVLHYKLSPFYVFRYERCLLCHSHLVSLRDEATRLVRDTPSSSSGMEENLLIAFAILD